jgi:hypothetical protein
MLRPIVHLEARLQPTSTMRSDAVREALRAHLDANVASLECESRLDDGWQDVPLLRQHVAGVRVGECSE